MINYNLENLGLDTFKRIQFVEFLDFHVKKNKKLGFDVCRRVCGLSRQQWDIFRIQNKELDVQWVF